MSDRCAREGCGHEKIRHRWSGGSMSPARGRCDWCSCVAFEPREAAGAGPVNSPCPVLGCEGPMSEYHAAGHHYAPAEAQTGVGEGGEHGDKHMAADRILGRSSHGSDVDPVEAAPLTLADVERWERLAEAATPGPWQINDRNEYGDLYIGTSDRDWFVMAQALLPHEPMRANAEFVAASREAVARLCAEVRRLAGELDEAQQEHQRFVEYHKAFSDECEKKIRAAEAQAEAARDACGADHIRAMRELAAARAKAIELHEQVWPNANHHQTSSAPSSRLRWEKAEQLDVLHDKLEELREENAALRARLEEVERERDTALAAADGYAGDLAAIVRHMNFLGYPNHPEYPNDDEIIRRLGEMAGRLAALAQAREKGDLR